MLRKSHEGLLKAYPIILNTVDPFFGSVSPTDPRILDSSATASSLLTFPSSESSSLLRENVFSSSLLTLDTAASIIPLPLPLLTCNSSGKRNRVGFVSYFSASLYISTTRQRLPIVSSTGTPDHHALSLLEFLSP
ncbi:hypothetical protein L1887_09947 [Cichorium endivia]|nr:hypothetical protein L1887_09947 [Cichorium endivia]